MSTFRPVPNRQVEVPTAPLIWILEPCPAERGFENGREAVEFFLAVDRVADLTIPPVADLAPHTLASEA